MWLAGETITDTHRLTIPVATLPSGTYQLTAGLYDPVTQERLPLSADAAQAHPDGLLLGTWQFTLYHAFTPMVIISPAAKPGK